MKEKDEEMQREMKLMLEEMKKEIIASVKEEMEKNSHSARLRERNRNDKPALRKDVSDAEIVRLYNIGFTAKEIAEKMKMSYNGIRVRLDKNGISLRVKNKDLHKQEETV